MTAELFVRLHNLVQEWEGKENRRVPANVITDMFNVYNSIFERKEYSKGCAGCRAKVWNRLKEYYHANKQQWGY